MRNLRTFSIQRRHKLAVFLGLTAAVWVAGLLSLCLGAESLALEEVIAALLGDQGGATAFQIVRYVRLPRTCACLLAGAALAASGVIIQGVLANSLASPSTIGVNSGAGLAVAICCAIAPTAVALVPLAALVGAFTGVLLVLFIAQRTSASKITLVLAGVAISSMFGAGVDLVVTLVPEALNGYSDFRIGGFSGVSMSRLAVAFWPIVLSIIAALSLHNQMDVLMLGTEQAQALGLPVVGTAARGGRGIAQLKTEIARLCQQKPAVPPAVPSATPPAKAGESTGATENMETEAHAAQLLQRAAEIAAQVTVVDPLPHNHDLQLDRLLTSRAAGIPAMLLLLALVLWITIRGANYPSALLSSWFHQLEAAFSAFLLRLAAPEWLRAMLAEGMLRSLGWVVAVMLPPMAIFFPLFTLLEDSGYLPRVAFNLDHCFRRCGAHGKQALTMCMGFGCNACGVTGCRIIESPRERLIAMLTNSFVPCNGRFPTLILLASIFFFPAGGSGAQLGAAFLLTALITGSIALSLAFSWLLSHSLLRGLPSSFVLELPPYRKPQVGQVILRSLLDRTLFVLGRAVLVAAPAGLLIWLLANITAGDASLLAHLTRWLDPLGRLLGLDGVILLAFLLGLPANELVLPLALMGYLAGGSLAELGSLAQLREVLVANGWTWLTALCTMLFSLFHFPCATTLLTIRKESGSTKWMLAAFLLPTIAGVFLCMLTAQLGRLFLT